MYNKLTVLLTLILFAASVQADINKQRALAEEMLEASNASVVVDNMTAQVEAMFAQTVQQLNVPGNKQAQVEHYGRQLSKIMAEDMSWEKMKPQFIDIYVEVFSEQELQGLIDFYNSPLGKKLITKMPQLMQESMMLAQNQMRVVIPKIKALAQEMQAELHQQPGG